MKNVSWDELSIMLNTKEVASVIGYGEQTVRELCHAGRIPFIRVGRAFMFPRDAIRKWVEEVAMNNCGNHYI